ncbi:hypothetical protein KA005_01410, partial [bacterium]|nr:hypothetical protein [bacterium]
MKSTQLLKTAAALMLMCFATGMVGSSAAEAAPLAISNMNQKGYTVEYDSLSVGQLIYTDRTYTFTSVPASYQGETYIQTANDDKGSTGTSFLTFDVNKDCTVYVAHDDTITTKPSWLSTFTDTGENLVSSDSSKTLSLYSKNFSTGTVTLGGNEGGGSSSMYSVVVVPVVVSAPGAAANPSPANAATEVSIGANLSWTAGSGATSHDVYFGT